jgi:membrane protease YdiL (CAAX protease family)
MSILRASDGRLHAGWRFLLAVPLVVASYVAAAVLAGLVAADWGRSGFEALFRPLLMGFAAAAFCTLLFVADRVPERLLAAQGLPRRGAGRDAALGVAIGAGMVGFAGLVVVLLGDLTLNVTLSAQTLLLALLQLWILATGAMAEEVMFRGYPFQRLTEAVGAIGATVLLSVMFAALHLSNPHAALWSWGFLNTAAVGVVLAVAYLRTRSLWLPWGIHFAWNFALGVGLGLPVSGLTQFAVVVEGEASGPEWLTGGSYGLEASATGFAAILLGLAAVVLLTRRHPARQSRTHLPEAYPQPAPAAPAAPTAPAAGE